MVLNKKGITCAVLSAVCYGTNPLGALMLYGEGLNTLSVLTLRFSLSSVILMMMLSVTHKGFFINLKEAFIISVLGVLFAISAGLLFLSFLYMDAGVASTLLFTYPIMVAAIMALFFKEKLSISTYIAIALAFLGVALLSFGSSSGSSWSWLGALFVILSSLSYSIYIIIVNKTSIRMSNLKLNFYVLTVCALCIIAAMELSGQEFILPQTYSGFFFSIFMAVVPSVLSMVFLSMAIHEIGSTPTATLGALEPLTAVIIGVYIFDEAFSPQLGLGIALTLAAVLLVTLGDQLSLHRVTMVINSIGKSVKKHWRWRI